jgi:xylose isomerase
MTTGFFGDITSIDYEGPDSTNPLAFRHYNPDEIVAGKRMEDHLRFAVCYWHSFVWPGGDAVWRPDFRAALVRRHDGPGTAQGGCRLRDVLAAQVALFLFP